MGAKIKFSNKKSINGEKIADIYVKSQKSFKNISCPVKYNSNAIDEFLIIFWSLPKQEEYLPSQI